jgi:hypothetical protein
MTADLLLSMLLTSITGITVLLVRVGFRYPLSDEYNEKTRLLGYRYPTPRITNSYRDSSVESRQILVL